MKRPRILSSTVLLLGVNIGVIGMAVVQSWSLGTVLWTYWLQSVIIGIFQFRRIQTLRDFDTSGMSVDASAVQASPRGVAVLLALFFAFHYGVFHAVYAVFLTFIAWPEWQAVAIAGAVFFANHFYSYRLSSTVENVAKPHIGKIMGAPYIRIVPMHLSLFILPVVISSTGGLVTFLGIKTLADVGMHLYEHRGDT